jgi:hypothetical protein
MTPRWTPLAIGYLALAIAGLVITWTFNGIAIAQGSTFFGEWSANGPATQSLQWDLIVVVAAASVLIVVEGRRIGMPWAWVFIPLSLLTAAAFTVPLFLALRERRLAARRSSDVV